MSQLNYRALMTLLVITITLGGSSLALRAAFPDAWRRFGKRLAAIAWMVALVGVLGWRGRATFGLPVGNAQVFLALTSTMLVSSLALFISAPLWAPLGVLTRKRGQGDVDNAGRRHFLRRLGGVMPVAAATAGPAGAVAATQRPVIREVEVQSSHVPAELDGLTLLQLSDVHLGAFIDVSQVRAVVEDIAHRPLDAIVLTGDIADDYSQLPEALGLLASLKPTLGMFACIGNHEVYRGRDEAVRIFEEGGARFLCNDGVVLEKNGARLFVAGADDPARLGQEHRPFLRKSVARALAACPVDVRCRVLLSHRPEGFEAGAEHGVTLTLSGHTHGAQMALLGRSLLGWALPDSYLLGRYRRGESQLYTSAGLGHWFPFRLNCPCEATLVTLRAV